MLEDSFKVSLFADRVEQSIFKFVLFQQSIKVSPMDCIMSFTPWHAPLSRGVCPVDRMTCFSKSSDLIWGRWRGYSAHRNMGDFPNVIQVVGVHPSHCKIRGLFSFFPSETSQRVRGYRSWLVRRLIWLRNSKGFQVKVWVPPGSNAYISWDRTDTWSLLSKGRGSRPYVLVSFIVCCVWEANCWSTCDCSK
jgi:hypothetical protein